MKTYQTRAINVRPWDQIISRGFFGPNPPTFVRSITYQDGHGNTVPLGSRVVWVDCFDSYGNMFLFAHDAMITVRSGGLFRYLEANPFVGRVFDPLTGDHTDLEHDWYLPRGIAAL